MGSVSKKSKILSQVNSKHDQSFYEFDNCTDDRVKRPMNAFMVSKFNNHDDDDDDQ